MVRIELEAEDAKLLREALTIYLADFRREVAGTENPDLRRLRPTDQHRSRTSGAAPGGAGRPRD